MMNRHDWFWLMCRGAGIWLLLDAIDNLPYLLERWLEGVGSEDTSARFDFLDVLVPGAIGGFLLFVRHRHDGAPAAAAPIVAANPPWTRNDLLWLGCKLAGLWLVVYCLNVVGGMTARWTMASDGPRWTESMLLLLRAVIIPLLIGCWLLFGSRLWRWSCR